MTVEVLSLGCRLNIAESERLEAMLGEARDLVVINSCAVTAEAVRQTRQTIRKARRARPDARLLVTGCAAEVEREALASMPEVDGLVPNAAKLDPRAWNVPAPLIPPSARPAMRHRTRAFVQVQNGCDHACTFCVIPQGRGRSRSRPIAEVLGELDRHLAAGVREIVLTGVDLTSWGADIAEGQHLGQLCAAILKAFPDLPRLRLSSIDGAEIDPLLLDLLGGEARLMPHVHLSLQHGNDLMLKRMKRRHSRADALRLADRLRARRPEIAFGADLIAGFPTEDDAAHADNLSIVRDLGIVHGHVFPFSPRPGTPAARMPRLAGPTIQARAAQLRETLAQVRETWLAAQMGKPLRVLAEKGGRGHAETFAPVRLPAETRAGTLLDMVPARVIEGRLEA